jgi:hypothetical protein
MADQNNPLKFPYEDAKPRLQRYDFNDELFTGAHFSAFRQKISNRRYGEEYEKLKYIVGNFAGLISKVCADMLFSEPPKFKVEDKNTQAWIDAFVFQNKLNAQNYESALGNSRHGDGLYKLRIDKLNPGDEEMTVICEDITPSIYFPTLNPGNMRHEPSEKELAWVVKRGGVEYLRKEIHTPGSIINKAYVLENNVIKQEVAMANVGEPETAPAIDTKVKKSLVIHVPNWRDGSRYFGYDDYGDLTTLFYSLNNRLTKTENILDKHADPILALPEGVLDENGQVKQEAFHMFEIPSDAGGGTPAKPEYIVWNASLESSFKQVDKIIEMLYMFSEISPDAFGMNKNGQAESGRALKLRLMRTIAKVARKRLYYDIALKEMFHTAQLFAAAHNVGVYNQKTGKYDIKAGKNIEIPEIEWQDGLPIDSREAVEEEQLRIESGNTSIVDSIMRLDRVDRDTAIEKAKEIEEEQPTIQLPGSGPVNPDTGNAGGKGDNNEGQ